MRSQEQGARPPCSGDEQGVAGETGRMYKIIIHEKALESRYCSSQMQYDIVG